MSGAGAGLVGGGGTSAVSVLTPNGRRVTVRVGPGTTLLQVSVAKFRRGWPSVTETVHGVLAPNSNQVSNQVHPQCNLKVLEDVCMKQNFSPNEYDLKFQRTVLDLSLQWRFANIPNNAKLEMVPVSHNRAGTETTVRIALQLDNGSRLQDTFNSSQTLWEILDHFAQAREYVEQHCEISPVCIYMRDEIIGKSALEKTSLKSLGLTGGNAIIRVVMKAPTTPDHTEAGSSKSPFKKQTSRPASWEEQAGPSVPHTKAIPTSSAHSVEAIFANRSSEKQGRSEKSPISSVEHLPPSGPIPSSFIPFVGGGQRLGGGSSNVAVAMRSPPSDVPLPSIPVSSPGGPSKPKKSKNSQVEQKEQKEYLEREPIVCHPDLQEPLDSGLQDLPDEFFEVTVDDVRRRLSQLQNERKRLEEAPLLTQAQRDAQKREKLDRYSKVVLRVYFPDGHILQAFFHPTETVGILKEFVKSHLADPEMPFYLFITPPRSILSDDSLTLFQQDAKSGGDSGKPILSRANLFPAAVVHFGSEKHSDHYLRPDLLESAVSPAEADLLVARSLPKPATRATQPISEPVPASPPVPNEADENVAVRRSETAPVLPQAQLRRTPSEKVPKWLKLPGGKR